MNDKSLSQLEGWKWKGEIPTKNSHSNIEYRFYKLHNIPISKLELSDVRFLIGQNSGLEFLVPLAISKLKEDIFIEVEYFPGDLFSSLLEINNEPNYWKSHSDKKLELINLYNSQKKNIPYQMSDEAFKHIKAAFKEFNDK